MMAADETKYESLSRASRKLRTIARVLELHRDGEPNRRIAEALNLSEDTVAEYLAIAASAPGRIWKGGRDGA